ncbi:MAG: imidazole glycerol phosphate synthase subunit HisH [Candidatus Marinimicrobia bacterium]|nr:imidazole glycerol phosphate synthase subunit HisH [Candidatus Neomarinimicrobiota bacterium]|tara:strand:+ start:432 stop:1040 length:609 start_codon:yes stop_codon:yes gene_type:complete
MIVIIDFGMGNIHSVFTQFKKINNDIIVSSSADEIKNAKKIILPGVGYFSKAMEKLNELNLIKILNEKVLIQKIPILGICLGMQLLGKRSEEGHTNGFGWVDAETVRFKSNNSQTKIPHMGWNNLISFNSESIFKGVSEKDEFYFVHSYYMKTTSNDIILAKTDYGHVFVSAIQKDNIYGTQFHPEKSHHSGRLVLKNFLEI